MVNRNTNGGLQGIVRLAAALVLAALLGGCVDIRRREYTPVTVGLDGRSELHISTYPSFFARETSDIPFLKKTVRTPESVFFQVFVRDAQQKAGPNPHIATIRIESFSYQLPGQTPVILIQNHDSHFWMQGDPKLNPDKPTPVPWVEDQRLLIEVSLVVNGKPYALKTEMVAVERQSTGFLPFHAMR